MNVPKQKVQDALAGMLDDLPAGTVVRLVVSEKGFRVSLRGVPPAYLSVQTAREVLAEHLARSGGGAIYAMSSTLRLRPEGSQGPDELSAGLVCDTPAEAGG